LKVFEQHIILDGDVITHGAFCNFCADNTHIRGERFVCKLCPNMDLCNQCFASYKNRVGNGHCQGHEFLKIPSDTSVSVTGSPVFIMSDSERDRWLTDLRDRYETKAAPDGRVT
jgi:hypothetical protein